MRYAGRLLQILLGKVGKKRSECADNTLPWVERNFSDLLEAFHVRKVLENAMTVERTTLRAASNQRDKISVLRDLAA